MFAGNLPSLGDFLRQAKSLHAITEKTIMLNGPKGQETHRYLEHENGSIAILPQIDDNEILTPVVFASLCRALGIPAQDFKVSPDFLTNPIRHLWDSD